MTSAPLLQYPDLPARWGIAIEEDRQRFRLVVPPVPGWRYLSRGYSIALAVAVALLAVHVIAGARMSGAEWVTMIVPVAMDGAVIFAVLVMAVSRLCRWLTFEVSADRLRFVPRWSFGSASRADWARADVLEVKQNLSNGKLLMRTRGEDMLDIFISPNREVTAYVVARLNEAMGRTFEAGPREAVEPVRPPASARARRGAMAAIYAASAVVVVVWFVWPTAGAILLFAGMAAAVPMGICMGTQKKDFWI